MKTTWKANPDRHDAGSRQDYETRLTLSGICVKADGSRISKAGVRARAKREKWRSIKGKGSGGLETRFVLDDLPEDVRIAVREHYGELPEQDVSAEIKELARATQKQRDRVAAWQAVIKKWREWYAENKGLGNKKWLKGRFVELVKLAQEREEMKIPELPWRTCQNIKRISVRTLERHEEHFIELGLPGLIHCQGGNNRGKTSIPEEQQKLIRGIMCKAPQHGARRIATTLKGKFGESAAGVDTVRRFIKRERAKHPGAHSLIKNPDDYRSNFELALGNASEKATHFMHYVEVDSTNGEIQCKDGKRYNICGLIDVFSRKAQFVVTPTSNSWAIAGLLWQTILAWGLPENLTRDRGKDFASKHISRALASVETRVIELPPFTPQGKPHIERVFRTLTHGLFEILPGYLGHNVAERKAIESRKSFADRLLKKNQEPIEWELTPAELQTAINNWTEQVYHQRTHSSLGASPNAKAASVPNRPRRIEDREALALLLAPSDTRTVGKKGLRYENGLYWDDPITGDRDPDSLINWVRREVMIRPDLGDAGRLFCFDPETKAYICQARDMAISGITVGEKIAAKKRARKAVMKQVAAMKTLAETLGDPLAEEIERIKREKGSVFNLPVGEPVEGNPFVDAAMEAAEAQRAQGEKIIPAEAERFSEPKEARGHLRVVSGAEDDEPKIPLFQSSIDLFEYFRSEQRERKLTAEEEKLVRNNVSGWRSWADMFIDQWDRGDQIWTAKMAPDDFWEYAENEGGYDSRQMPGGSR